VPLLLLAACWSPDPDVGAPSLVPLDPLEEPVVEEDAPDAPEGEPAEGEADPDAEAGEEEHEPPFVPYDATLIAAPVTLVDDVGTPVTVLQRPGVALRVIDEEPIRKRVSCDACQPPAESWLQTQVVTGRP